MTLINKTRRAFLRKSTLAAAGVMIVPNVILGRSHGHTSPSDKMNIAGIGIGGKGRPNLKAMETENIVALCDVDWKYAKRVFDEYPKAKRYYDWRTMFDEMHDSIDGVMVSTADHTHAVISAGAITLGKHVHCQKPLTHSIYESRLLSHLAQKYKVATQMGNQGNSGPEVRDICEWIWNGEIGEVREVHAWTNRPIWPQGLNRPAEAQKIPDTLKWDLFIGPAPYRPYHSCYHPWNWRGYWDFGTGALGDMACHVLDPVFRALDLGYPIEVEASSTSVNIESPPQGETIHFKFPARPGRPKCAMPEVMVSWYDGGIFPKRPKELLDGQKFVDKTGGGVLFVGSKDILFCESAGRFHRLLSGRQPQVPHVLRRIEGAQYGVNDDTPHAQDWIRACKESSENRVLPSSSFEYAGPFTEMVLMGVLASRLQPLHRTLQWDGLNMKFLNVPDSDEFQIMIRDGFKITDGNPRFNKEMTDPVHAKAFIAELVKHTYRQGWSLPDMK